MLAFSFPLGASLILGLAFLLVSLVAVFLMFRVWGYPHDPVAHTHAAPRSLQLTNRAMWWIYLLIYLVMMSQMVPRMWQYQIEFPPRTVMHIVLGLLIGLLLLLKFSVARWFRHLEEWTPVLGVLLLACTILLSGLSMPFALQEAGLARNAVGGGVFSMENRARVAKLLPQAEMPADAPLEQLSTVSSLMAGREVLASKCIVCHDLKTILVQPRTPSNWWRTVERMGSKPTFSDPLTDQELYTVTSYLVAIGGELQRSAKARKEVEDKRTSAVAEMKQEAKAVAGEGTKEADTGDLPAFDEAVAAKTYDRLCAQCHDLADIEAHPPKNSDEVKNLIIRMISENGMEAPREELDLVYLHMVKKYAGGKVLTAPAEPTPSAKKPDATDPAPTPDEATKPDPGGEPAAAAGPDGAALYLRHCKACHAPDGKGTEGMKKNNIPDMSDPAWQAQVSLDKVIEVVTAGLEGTKMKSFKDKLKPDEIAAVADFVKQLK